MKFSLFRGECGNPSGMKDKGPSTSSGFIGHGKGMVGKGKGGTVPKGKGLR